MPMSDGKSTLKKIAFQVGDKFFRFAINPQSYAHSKPHRTAAVKTKSRIIIEDFQEDIPTITIAGTTGFNPTGKKADRGIAKIKALKKFMEDYATMGGNGNKPAKDFYFHNFTNDESFVVHLSPEGVTYTQDVSQPLLFNYEIKFIVLRKATDPADEDIVNPEIGNRYPSVVYSGPGSATPMPSPNVKITTAVPLNPNIDYSGIGLSSPNLPGINSYAPGYGGSSSVGGSINGNGSTGSGNTSDGGYYDPGSGNSDIYNNGTAGPYVPSTDGSEPINPQAPSSTSYQYGMTGLGFNIGYYGRNY